MNAENSIKQHIAALREEVDRQRSERHLAIDRLESDLLGLKIAENDPMSPNIGSDASNVDRVLNALDSKQLKAVSQVAKESGLTEPQACGALYARSMTDRIERRKRKGKPIGFRLRPSPEASASPRPDRTGIARLKQHEAAEMILRQSGGPLKAIDLANRMMTAGFPAKEAECLKRSIVSTMSRKPNVFRKTGPGIWTLT